MYEFAKRNRVAYNLAFVPGNFRDTSTEAFDPEYMSGLFDLGFQLGKSGHLWKNDAAATGQPVMTQNPSTPWQAIAIVLAVLLVAALIGLALILSGVMKLGLSLL
ncbi:MAG TPA: hypothetical protein VGY14_05725 [Methyloceanibacter sp.]|jgi:hypothetical protein|nr:hypothetical protein [Methyloceanibacter sp.]